MFIQCRNVRSLAKKALASVRRSVAMVLLCLEGRIKEERRSRVEENKARAASD